MKELIEESIKLFTERKDFVDTQRRYQPVIEIRLIAGATFKCYEEFLGILNLLKESLNENKTNG